MSEQDERAAMTRKTVVYEMPGMDAVTVERDRAYGSSDDGALTFDLYRPPAPTDRPPPGRLPATLFVVGFVDPMFARGLKETGGYTSWGRLVAASGAIAITYAYRDPVADLDALLRHLRENAAALGIDETRMAVWAGSGNGPMGLSLLMREAKAFRCAALLYPFLLDTADTTHVADAARLYRFANPCAGRSIDDVPPEVPLFVVRAGKDAPQLNQTIDAFLAGALAHNLPVSFTNHATGPHAFDLLDDSETSREIVRRVLAFLRFHLLA